MAPSSAKGYWQKKINLQTQFQNIFLVLLKTTFEDRSWKLVLQRAPGQHWDMLAKLPKANPEVLGLNLNFRVCF